MECGIKFYLPPEALQGQDVPCNLTWNNVHWSSIIIKIPLGLELINAYNVNIIEYNNSEILIKSLERDGYIGLLFKSNQLQSTSEFVEVGTVFNLVDDNPIELYRKINLFRPTLKLTYQPSLIYINKDGKPSEKIGLHRNGFGTIIVSIYCSDDSELITLLPDNVKKAMEGFIKDFHKEMLELEQKYPNYSDFFNYITAVDMKNNENAMIKVSTYLDDFNPEKEFVDDLIKSFIKSMISNSEFENMIVRPLLNFIDSGVAKKVIYSTTFNEIEVTENEQTLILNIECADFTASKILTIQTSPIIIKSDITQRVKISEIINWIE